MAGVFLFAKEFLPYQQVVEFEGKSKDELFDVTRQNLAIIFVNSNFAIQYQDKDNGTIIANCHDDVKWNFMKAPTDYKLTINIKDGKMRFSFSDVSFTVTVGMASSKGTIVNEKSFNDFKKYADSVIENIKNKTISNISDDDW